MKQLKWVILPLVFGLSAFSPAPIHPDNLKLEAPKPPLTDEQVAKVQKVYPQVGPLPHAPPIPPPKKSDPEAAKILATVSDRIKGLPAVSQPMETLGENTAPIADSGVPWKLVGIGAFLFLVAFFLFPALLGFVSKRMEKARPTIIEPETPSDRKGWNRVRYKI